MKKNIVFISLGICLVLSFMVTLRLAVPSREPSVTPNTTIVYLTDTVGKGPTSPSARTSRTTEHTEVSATLSLSGPNGVIAINTVPELLSKLGQINAGDTKEELKAVFGKYPKEITDNGALLYYAYYCGSVEIAVYGEYAMRVIATDAGGNRKAVIFETDFTQAQAE